MADNVEKKIILSTEAKTEGAATNLNALTNVIDHVTSSVMGLLTMNLRMQQSNINVRNSVWGLVDAERAYVRLALQRVELDQRQAELNVKMAQRELIITQRTGRRLDVMQARLNVEKAQRDAALTNFDIETQRWSLQKQQITAEEQHNIALQQHKLLMASLIIQTVSMITQTAILIGLIWEKILAMTVEQAIATAGLSLIIAGAAAAGAYALYAKMKPPAPKTGNAPSTTNNNQVSYQSNFNVQGDMGMNTYRNARQVETSNLTSAGRRDRMAT
jgi:hypothetical protein